MAPARLSMRRIREVLRLKVEARLSDRQIAAAVGASCSTVQECLRRCPEAGITWPPPTQLDDVALIARLYRRDPRPSSVPLPDFAHVHRELAHRGVTRLLLWQSQHPDGLVDSATPLAPLARPY